MNECGRFENISSTFATHENMVTSFSCEGEASSQEVYSFVNGSTALTAQESDSEYETYHVDEETKCTESHSNIHQSLIGSLENPVTRRSVATNSPRQRRRRQNSSIERTSGKSVDANDDSSAMLPDDRDDIKSVDTNGIDDYAQQDQSNCAKALWRLCDPVACFPVTQDDPGTVLEGESTPTRRKENRMKRLVDRKTREGKRTPVGGRHNMLYVRCSDSYTSSETVAMLLFSDSSAAREYGHGGKYPLHAACCRTLASHNRHSFQGRRQNSQRDSVTADKSIESDASFREGTLCDISDLMKILDLLLNAYPEAARLPDFSGDLPAHHLARQMWRLEQEWAEEMQFDMNKNDRFVERSFATTSPLLHDITNCAESVLKPIGNIRALCRGTGSVGTLLPLHIACIHGVSFNTLQSLLDGYPEAAAVPCSKALLGIDGAFPLELFEARRPSTWNSSQLVTKKQSEVEEWAFNRCSDLIFAHYPSILPYRRDPRRIRRIEGAIIKEARSSRPLTHTTKMLWLWLCTFTNEQYDDDDYSESVKNILTGLDRESTKKLVSVTSRDSGKRIIDIAAPVCAVELWEALRSKGMSNNGFHEVYPGRRYTTVGSLCRAAFGVDATFIPTNFIILPYKIKFADNDLVTLESKHDSRIAMTFASVLSRILNAEDLFHTIMAKNVSSYYSSNNIPPSYSMEGAIEKRMDSLLMTYHRGQGFLYLLDEESGNPVVAADEQIYPIKLDMHSNSARRLLPLMQMGIQLMRGKSGLSVLGQLLVKGNFPNVSDSWFDATSSVLAMLREFGNQDTHALQDELERCFGSRQWRAKEEFCDEASASWESEISSLQQLLKKHDPEQTYSGLRRVFGETGSFCWTQQSRSVAILDSLGMNKMPCFGANYDPFSETGSFCWTQQSRRVPILDSSENAGMNKTVSLGADSDDSCIEQSEILPLHGEDSIKLSSNLADPFLNSPEQAPHVHLRVSAHGETLRQTTGESAYRNFRMNSEVFGCESRESHAITPHKSETTLLAQTDQTIFETPEDRSGLLALRKTFCKLNDPSIVSGAHPAVFATGALFEDEYPEVEAVSLTPKVCDQSSGREGRRYDVEQPVVFATGVPQVGHPLEEQETGKSVSMILAEHYQSSDRELASYTGAGFGVPTEESMALTATHPGLESGPSPWQVEATPLAKLYAVARHEVSGNVTYASLLPVPTVNPDDGARETDSVQKALNARPRDVFVPIDIDGGMIPKQSKRSECTACVIM